MTLEISYDYWLDSKISPFKFSIRGGKDFIAIKDFDIGEIIKNAVIYETQIYGKATFSKQVILSLKGLVYDLEMLVEDNKNE